MIIFINLIFQYHFIINKLPWITAELSLIKNLFKYFGINADKQAKANASLLNDSARNGAQSESRPCQ